MISRTLPDKAAGNLTVPAGQRLTFRYRFYLHEGDDHQAKVAEKYRTMQVNPDRITPVRATSNPFNQP